MADLTEVDFIIADLDSQLKEVKKLKASGVKFVTPTDEATEPTDSQIKAEESRKMFRMLNGSIERELTRIKNENVVKLGDSFFNEAACVDEVTKALKVVQSKYEVLC